MRRSPWSGFKKPHCEWKRLSKATLQGLHGAALGAWVQGHLAAWPEMAVVWMAVAAACLDSSHGSN